MRSSIFQLMFSAVVAVTFQSSVSNADLGYDFSEHFPHALELFEIINHRADETWKLMLDCSEGNVERAQESYRSKNFCVQNKVTIESNIREIRANLGDYTTTSDRTEFKYNADLVKTVHERCIERSRQVYRQARESNKPEAYRADIALARKCSELNSIRYSDESTASSAWADFVTANMPKLKSYSPVLSQILLEEVITQFNPRSSPRAYSRQSDVAPNDPVLVRARSYLRLMNLSTCEGYGFWPEKGEAAIIAFDSYIMDVFMRSSRPTFHGRFLKKPVCGKYSNEFMTSAWREMFAIGARK